MKKLICILAAAALLGACEKKTEVIAPASSQSEKKSDPNTLSKGMRADGASIKTNSAAVKADAAATAASPTP